MAGGVGGGSPPLFSYLNMLFNDALVNISNFCNLYYISYIEKKTLKSVQGPYFACCLLVYNGVREVLNHAFVGAVLHSSPLHSALV